MKHLRLLALAACLLPVRAAEPAGRPDLMVADFEGSDYGAWATTGEAFGPGPAQGALPGQMPVNGYKGHGLVNSFYHGDGSTGTLTSPEFKVERRYIRFLIGGGMDAEKTCMHLLVDGRVVRRATGPNDKAGGSETLAPDSWDVSEFEGRGAVIRIVDAATGGWGHINVDDIVQTDRRPPGVLTNAARSLRLEKAHLNLPVKTGGPKRRMTFEVDGGPKRDFEIELADGAPDWWAFIDVTAFKGRDARLVVDKLPEESTGLSAVDQTDAIHGAASLYQEALRPQFHFSPRRGWNNDPNGLVYYKGEYHLFFQHNPYGWAWGNMHWGHAVSRDLVHWSELPEALFPDEHGTMFSGSAVVDEANTAGFQTGDEKPLVCIFTAAGTPFTQGIAYSNDRGRTWTKYPGNPVLPHIEGDNRDPKVIWYAPEKKWVMALYLDRSDYALFASKDLKRWDKLSDVHLAGAGECPEFFEIPLDGARSDTRWVFYGGNGLYLVGRFDGRVFKAEFGPVPMHRGNCWYASQTYNGIPASDGRRILIPWGQMSTPGMPFNQMMGVPVELTLRSTPEGPRLFANPIAELASLRDGARKIGPAGLNETDNPLAGVEGELLDITAEVGCGSADQIHFTLRGVDVTYNTRLGELSCLDKKAPLQAVGGRIKLRFLVDRTSIDIFGNDGALYMPMGVIVSAGDRTLAVHAKGPGARLDALEASTLHSAWPAP
jgi:fructan beta-fructosidase